NIDQPFGEAVDIFMDKYAVGLDKTFRESKNFQNIKKVTVYLEYIGENSFAGMHEESDDKDLVLIDVERYQKGFIEPRDFIRDFSYLGIPELVYQGEYSEEFIKKIREGYYDLDEGVVCKGVDNKKVWMVKIKTIEWLKRVKDKMGISYIEE